MRSGAFSAVFRVTGGPRLGFGHVRRCWTLATRLIEEGASVTFVTASPDAGPVLNAAGFAATVEASESALEATLRACRAAARADVCIVDDPSVSLSPLAAVKDATAIVCIDDMCQRDFPVDLVVNGAVGAETLAYRSGEGTRFLLGPAFVLLRPSFVEAPDRPAPAGPLRRVLVLVGGGDVASLPQAIVAVIGETLPGVGIDVVIGPFGTDLTLSAPLLDRVAIHRSPADVRGLMLAADLAVSGGGQALYELAATATPTIAMQLAADQAINLRGMTDAGIVRPVGPPNEPGFSARLRQELSELDRDPHARAVIGAAGRRLVDGRGTERVAAAVTALCAAGAARS